MKSPKDIERLADEYAIKKHEDKKQWTHGMYEHYVRLSKEDFISTYTLCQQDMKNDAMWIDVNDRLPTKSGYYLIWSTFNCDKVWYNSAEEYFGTNSNFRFLPTHWMPLPQKPQFQDEKNKGK